MRQKVLNRRAIEIADFEYSEGQRYTAAVSRFQNGTIAEVFLTSGKFGAAVNQHAQQDSAILCSLCLQHGVPLETIVHAIRALALFTEARP